MLGPEAGPGMLAVLHYLAASLDLRASAFEASIREWERALELFREGQNRLMESAVLAHLSIALQETGRGQDAVAVLRRAVDLVQDGATPHGLAFALVHLAHTQLDLGEDDDVGPVLERADEAARRVQNPRCQAWAAWGRARTALAGGDPAAALRECRSAVDLLQDREFPWALTRLHDLLDHLRSTAPGVGGGVADAGQVTHG